MRIINAKAIPLILATLFVLATFTVIQVPQANAAAGTHQITAVYYKAYIYNDHDADVWPFTNAGEWYFDLYAAGSYTAERGPYSRDGPGYVDFSDVSRSWSISGSTTYWCWAGEDDGITGVYHDWDYQRLTRFDVSFPGPTVNTWHEYDKRDGDVYHYSRYYIRNLYPTVGSISGPSSGYRLVAYTFTAFGSDPEGDSITYQWLVDGVIQMATGSTLTYTFPTSAAVATHTIQVRARDYFGAYSAYSTKSFAIYNRAPTVGLISGISSGYPGIAYGFATSGSDPDGDLITYEWSVNWVIQASTGSSMVYTFPTTGSYTVRVRTRDSKGMYSGYSSKLVTITSAVVNTVIVFSFSPNPALPGQTVTLSGTLKTVTAIPVFPASVKVEYSTNGGATWSFFTNLNTNAVGAFSVGFNAPGAGSYLVRVSYAGSASYNPSSSTQTLIVTSGKVNTVIVFSFSPNPALPGQTVTLSGTLKTATAIPVFPASVKVEYSTNGGATWSFFTNLNTNAAGQFSTSFGAPGTGTYLARVSYAGSASYNPSSSTQTLTVS